MNLVALPEVATIIMGQSPPSSYYNTRGEGLPFFQGKADFGDLYPTVRMFCTEPNKVAEAGDILISVRAPVGPTNISPAKCCIGRGLAAIRCSQAIESKYLLYFLRFYEPELVRVSSGSTFDAISRDDLENIQVPLPPLPEQKRIAAILAKADRLRRLRRTARDLSDTYLQSVFLEMFGDPVSNPKGWEVCSLKTLVQPGDRINYGVVQPGSDFPGGVPIVRVGDFDDIAITTETLKRIDPAMEAKYKRSRLRGDEVLIACVGSIGKIALASDKLKGFNVVRAVARVPVNDSINRLFLASYLATPFIQRYFNRETRTVSQPTLNIEQIQETPIFVPPLPLQQQFAHIVHQFERLRAQQREAERQAEHLFQTLLHQAFRGEL